MRKFLFFPRHEANFYELISLASLLAKDDKVYFLIVSKEMLMKFKDILKEKKILILNLSEEMKFLNYNLSMGIGFCENKSHSLFAEILSNNFFINSLNSFFFFYFYLASYLRIKKVLKEKKIEKIILCGDRELGVIRLLLKFSEVENIKIIIIHNAWTDKKFFYHTRIKKNKFSIKFQSNFMNYIFFKFFKSQLTIAEENFVLFSPCWVLIPLGLLGMLPSNPWYLGKSSNSQIFLDCKITFKLLRQIINPKRLNLIGSSNLDNVFKKNKSTKTYSKTCILCVPFFAEAGYTTFNYQLKIMDEMIGKIQNEYKVLISLHPKADEKFYKKKFSKFKVKFLKDAVEKNFHKCNFIICCNSLIIKKTHWVDLPTINYDFLNQKFSEISNYKNVLQISNMSEYDKLKRFVKKYKRSKNKYFSKFKFPTSKNLINEICKD